MPFARLSRWLLAAACALGLLLAACGGNNPGTVGQPTPAGDGQVIDSGDGGDNGDTGDQPPAPTPTAGPQVPETVPLLETAFDMAITDDASAISYKSPDTFADAVAWYQTALEEAGWERINSKDAEFGGATTLLRARPEATISVTIQEVPGDEPSVRVQISYTEK